MDRTDEEFILSSHLKAAFNNCSTSDLTIEVRRQPIYVHKHILKMRSTYFKNMFRFNGLENRVIKNDDHPYIVYKAFLKYLLHRRDDFIIYLLILSDKYCVKTLERDCIQMIIEKMTAPNIFSIKEVAIKYGKKELKEYCDYFLLKRCFIPCFPLNACNAREHPLFLFNI